MSFCNSTRIDNQDHLRPQYAYEECSAFLTDGDRDYGCQAPWVPTASQHQTTPKGVEAKGMDERTTYFGYVTEVFVTSVPGVKNFEGVKSRSGRFMVPQS